MKKIILYLFSVFAGVFIFSSVMGGHSAAELILLQRGRHQDQNFDDLREANI